MVQKKDAFEEGYFWEYYMDLERQFVEYLNYVPYLEGNEQTYSFRLVNLILSIGAHIDSAFKEIARFPEFSNKYPELLNPKDKGGRRRKPNIKDYYQIESEYSLSQRKVLFKTIPERMPIFPFKDYDETKGFVPIWWSKHNKLKHKFSKENFKLANLMTARDALAGAFLLNVIHKPAVLRLDEYGLIVGKHIRSLSIRLYGKHFLKNSKPPATIETEIFFYDYEDNPPYK